MKKVLLIAVAMIIMVNLSAQTRIGIQAGANFSDMKMEGQSIGEKFSSKAGFTAGLVLDFKLIGPLGLNTGLFYSQNNFDVTQEGLSETIKTKSSSIQLPVNLTLGLNLGIIRPFVMAGPYADYGIEYKQDGEKMEYGKDSGLERFNYGIAFGGGVDLFKFLRLQYQYDMGLSSTKVSFEDATNTDLKSRQHRVSVAVLF